MAYDNEDPNNINVEVATRSSLEKAAAEGSTADANEDETGNEVDEAAEDEIADADEDATAEEGDASEDEASETETDEERKAREKRERAESRKERRIDKLTKERNELQQELEALRKQREEQPVEGLTEEEVERRAEALAQQRLAERALANDSNKLLKQAQKADERFDDNVADMAEELGNIPQNMIYILANELDHDNGGEVLAYLASNIDEAEDIYRLANNPVKMALKLNKISDTLKTKPSRKEAKPRSNAPAPIRPVTENGRPAVGALTGKEDMETFMRVRNAQAEAYRKSKGGF